MAGSFSDAGISGATPIDKRFGLLDILSLLKRGDVVPVAKRDRLGRDWMVIAMIEAAMKQAGARIASAAGEGTDSDDPSAILFRRVASAGFIPASRKS